MASVIKIKTLLQTTPRYQWHSPSSSCMLKNYTARCYSKASRSSKELDIEERVIVPEVEESPTSTTDNIPSSGISRPLSEILKELNKKVPDSLIRLRSEEGFTSRYVPWHIVNRIMNLHAPEWSGEVRDITYSPDGKTVSVIYRVTLYGTDAEIYRESIGTAAASDTQYGDPVQKAEAMAFRRACARLGLGLHLYHEDL